MADIFLGTEVEPSAFEIALQQIFLSGLQQRVAETGDLSSAVDATLGFKRDAGGNLVPLTEQERFDSLGPVEQQTFNLFKQQVSQLEGAFAGEPSEAFQEKKRVAFEGLSETAARAGQGFTGSDPRTATAKSTVGIRRLSAFNRTFDIAEDTERRNLINTGLANVFNSAGLLERSRTQNIANLTNAPRRFDVFQGGGLLENAAARSTFEAQSGQNVLNQLINPSLAAGGEFLKKLIF